MPAPPVLRMAGADERSRIPMTLFAFNEDRDIADCIKGCDGDIGGTSTVHFELDKSTETEGASKDPLAPLRPTAKLWGNMSLAVRKGFEGKIVGGYAGFRTKVRLTCSAVMGRLQQQIHCSNDQHYSVKWSRTYRITDTWHSACA